jgi:hypothetical protein
LAGGLRAPEVSMRKRTSSLIALPALGVVIVAGMRGHTAPAARVRPALGPTTRPDAPDFAGRVLKGVAEAMGLWWRRGGRGPRAGQGWSLRVGSPTP